MPWKKNAHHHVLTFFWDNWKLEQYTLKDRSLSYLRYLDDIFMIWIGTHDELNIFTNKMNHIHPSIKFTLQTEINLDTTIYKRDNS